MNLEHQVCSLDLSKMLKELGVKQESIFVWVELVVDSVGKSSWNVRPSHIPEPNKKAIAAFTVAELGEMLLRSEIDGSKPIHGFRCFLDYRGKMVFGWDRHIDFSPDTEADARAKMLIYLLEHKLL